MAKPEALPRGVASGLDALAARHGLPDEAVRRLGSLIRLVTDNPRAPTAIRDPLRVLDDHVADSLVGLDVQAVRHASRVVDLGSGAGFPGLPLAIALPETLFALVESEGRKCAFIEQMAQAAEAGNVKIVNARAEAWTAGSGRFDVVTARAVAPLDVVVEYAAPLLRPGGVLVVWQGRHDKDAEDAGARAAALIGMEPVETLAVVPYEGARDRHLTLMSKVRSTPSRYPRRPGMASKRPLGGPRPAKSPADRGENSSDRSRR